MFGVTLPIPAGSLGVKAIAMDSRMQVMENQDLIVPETLDIKGDSHVLYLGKLITRATDIGVTVVFVQRLKADNNQEMLWGYTVFEDKMIFISTSLSLDAQLATLFHELGHMLQPKDLFPGKNHDHDAQVFAESVSVLACQELGLDITPSSFGYLQQFPNRHAVIQRYSTEIDAAVTKLLIGVK